MDELTFCKTICKAQCCYITLPEELPAFRCSRLNEDNTCSCYQERYEGDNANRDLVVVGYYSSRTLKEIDGKPATRPILCGKMKQLHARGLIPKELADKCCVIKPEILEHASTN